MISVRRERKLPSIVKIKQYSTLGIVINVMVISYGMENRSSLGQASDQGKIEADMLMKPDLLVGCGPPLRFRGFE